MLFLALLPSIACVELDRIFYSAPLALVFYTSFIPRALPKVIDFAPLALLSKPYFCSIPHQKVLES